MAQATTPPVDLLKASSQEQDTNSKGTGSRRRLLRSLKFPRRPPAQPAPNVDPSLGVNDKRTEQHPVCDAPMIQNVSSSDDADKHEGDVEELTDEKAVPVTRNEYQGHDRTVKTPSSPPNVDVGGQKPNAMRRVLTKLNPGTRANRAETHPLLRRGPNTNQRTQMDSQTQLATPRVGRSKSLFFFKRKDLQIGQSTATSSQAQLDTVPVGRSKTVHFFERNNLYLRPTIASQTHQPVHIVSDSPSPSPSPSGAIRNEDKDPHEATLHTEGGQLEPADAGTTQTAGEFEEMEKLRRDLFESRSRVAELQKRCEAQSRDLEISNRFLDATDKSSDSDVIIALQKLNAEVQQSTTFMADSLTEDFEFKNSATDTTEEQISTVRWVSDTIGPVLAKSLGTRPPEGIPMLLPIAFQAYLVSVLAQTASSWVFEQGHNKFINAIYQSLRGAEAQAVSGRWRVLARLHIVHAWVNRPEDTVKAIIAGFANVLLVAGCTAPRSDITAKITSAFELKIALLVDLAVRLNKLFDEIVSSDFEILVVRPGEKFESKNMEDTDSDEIGVQDASVLCSTHLGLTKWMPVGTLWERVKKQKLIVLKPKVLLESLLDAEDQ